MKIAILLIQLLLPLFAFAQSSTVTITINNLEKKNGTLYIAWYRTPAAYVRSTNHKYGKLVQVNGKFTAAVTFPGVGYGKYAIAVFLDENKNGKLDRSFLGIPKEKYGSSNNIFPAMRRSTFQEASISISSPVASLSINLK